MSFASERHLAEQIKDAEYRGPTRGQILEKMAERQREIEWNIRRLGYLVMSDEDRAQTEDLITELRGELNSLSWCFNAG